MKMDLKMLSGCPAKVGLDGFIGDVTNISG